MNIILNRDLATRNILLDKEGTAVVSDFGFARELHSGIDSGKTQSDLGPVRWM